MNGILYLQRHSSISSWRIQLDLDNLIITTKKYRLFKISDSFWSDSTSDSLTFYLFGSPLVKVSPPVDLPPSVDICPPVDLCRASWVVPKVIIRAIIGRICPLWMRYRENVFFRASSLKARLLILLFQKIPGRNVQWGAGRILEPRLNLVC